MTYGQTTFMQQQPSVKSMVSKSLCIVFAGILIGCNFTTPKKSLIEQVHDNAQHNMYNEELFSEIKKEDPKSIIPQLLPLLQDENRNVRSQAVHIIGLMGYNVVPELIPLLRDKDDEVNQTTATVLGKMGEIAQPAVDVLIQDLHNSTTEEERWRPLLLLGLMGKTAKSAVPTLINELKNSKSDTVGALSSIGEPAIPPLRQLLTETKSPRVRSLAIQTLGAMGKVAKSSIPQISPFLKDPHPEVQVNAASALQGMGEDGKKILPILIKALNSKDRELQLLALSTLEKMGETAKPLVPIIVTIFKDPNPRLDPLLRTRSAEVLGKLGEISVLIDGLQDPNPLIPWRAAHVLGLMGETAKPAVPKLIEAVQNQKNERLRRHAVEALGYIGLKDKSIIVTIKPVLKNVSEKDPDRAVQNAARSVLNRLS